MDRLDVAAIAREVRKQGGQLILRPRITTRQIRDGAKLERAVSLAQPSGSGSTICDPTTGLIRFAWGVHGFPPNEVVDWVMTD